MRKQILLCMLATSVMSTVQADDKLPDMSSYTAAYSGGEGYQVWIARYGPKEQHESLVQIVGIDHKLDGRVLRARQEPSGSGLAYFATVDGKPVELVKVEGQNAQLNITGNPWKSQLCYDKSLSADRPPQHLLTAYQNQSLKK